VVNLEPQELQVSVVSQEHLEHVVKVARRDQLGLQGHPAQEELMEHQERQVQEVRLDHLDLLVP